MIVPCACLGSGLGNMQAVNANTLDSAHIEVPDAEFAAAAQDGILIDEIDGICCGVCIDIDGQLVCAVTFSANIQGADSCRPIEVQRIVVLTDGDGSQIGFSGKSHPGVVLVNHDRSHTCLAVEVVGGMIRIDIERAQLDRAVDGQRTAAVAIPCAVFASGNRAVDGQIVAAVLVNTAGAIQYNVAVDGCSAADFGFYFLLQFLEFYGQLE